MNTRSWTDIIKQTSLDYDMRHSLETSWSIRYQYSSQPSRIWTYWFETRDEDDRDPCHGYLRRPYEKFGKRGLLIKTNVNFDLSPPNFLFD